MDIKQIVKMIAQMSNLSTKQQNELLKIIDQIDEDVDSLEDIDNLTLDNFDLDEIDFDQFDLDKLGSRGPPGFGNDFDDRTPEDFKYDGGEKPKEKVDDEINIDISNDENLTPYQDDTWIEVDGKFETFIDIPDDTDEINIEIKSSHIKILDPVDKKVPTDKLPIEVTSLEAEVTESGRLLLRSS